MSTGVFFGGRSVEHEVSVITALQVMAALPRDDTTPVYIAKSGAWYTGDVLRELDAYRDVDALLQRCTRVTLRPEPGDGALHALDSRRGLLGGGDRVAASIDVAMPLVHGTFGEDGTLQGLFELAGVAYTGCGVAAAAVSMDKRATKAMFRSAGLPVLDDVMALRRAFLAEPQSVLRDVERGTGYPVFVKPLSLGSSIGVTRAADSESLHLALTTALTYDTACIVERAQEPVVEINCAVLGREDQVRISVCEQPASSGLLTYEDKYLTKGGVKGAKGAQRVIPAPISASLTQRIQDAAATAFHAIGAEGVARVDFLVDAESERFVVNEINTIPGSLSFYLWEPAGLAFVDLIGELIELARRRHEERRATTFSIDTWLLSGRPPS
ncbi:MAG: D-alanine--D-alanine ligase [Candidatus Dormibacteraeota bacterium]|nr:D-alanine--D-alanine ligase [Candidatus Dormibacteraeota bacterium]